VTAGALMADLRRRGVGLAVVGERVRYWPAAAVTPADVELLRQHKREVLARLHLRDAIRRVAARYPAASGLARTPEAATALERLDAALVAAINADDLQAAERALGEWEGWWAEWVAVWRAGGGTRASA
jgi:hypothetical protein